ncbi:hypothetical protein [Saccharopolyspora phatthalungensis]|uniref:Bifunctional DNA-binding transcriptional regulator/antitoxin component of YhaV-PrlF toxin-antitoxin module n=1 Tax=Saccharopolyspora phatthalungensis TaxID=664693 RepID=A0A840QBS4_9PSEU|nr:hypothetical protein [Saccharopolyspora phatthalungensis]MBB5157397.1 bifunctional DNA-binding transcriptional regulator/antitoxin component of YhaV-PrlF toxin-antitoxin module [Saccharopolyspora phatthalungensis]
MAEQIVSAVVPRAGGTTTPSVRPVRDVARALPLPVLPHQASMTYGMGRVDASGRVAQRSVLRTLGWSPGEALVINITRTVIVVRRDPHGPFCLGHKPYLVLPAPVRDRCQIRAGDQVLLAADPQRDVLIVHTLASLDQVLVERHAGLLGGETA